MKEQQKLNPRLDAETFRSRYYRKEELADFCRASGLPASGGKEALTERIARYLETGELQPADPGAPRPRPSPAGSTNGTSRAPTDTRNPTWRRWTNPRKRTQGNPVENCQWIWYNVEII